MVDLSTCDGVWIFYDGQCPMCSSVADYLRIKKKYGPLNLVDARDPLNCELVRSVNEQGFDLDEGVVIVHDGRFLHGEAALRFMAKHSAVHNFFNLVCKGAFWSQNIAGLIYPWLRGCRNWLLRRRQIERIDNLQLCEEPIFQSVFGESWARIAPVIRKRYANRPYTDDKIVVEGALDITCAGSIRFLAPLFWVLRTVPPINEKRVPVSVEFDSDRYNKELHFNRVFQFRHRRPYILKSRMSQVKANEIVEVLNFGICWLGRCSWQEGRVVMEHKGYALKLLGHSVPLPITCVLGRVESEEIPVGTDTFHTRVTIKHPWFGVVYEYKGLFKITSGA